MTSRLRRAGGCVGLLVALVGSSAVFAVQTRTWTESVGEMQLGRSDGIAVTSYGRLAPAPHLVRVGDQGPAGGAVHVWAAARDSRGNLVLGTGPGGTIVRITPAGSASIVAKLAEPMVTALLALPDGVILAGTAAHGTIYKIRPGAEPEVWCETGERYVWSLAAGPDATVFAGTGDQGRILKITASGKAEPFFESGESHIMTLATLPNGEILAGGAGRGLLYRLDRAGRASVLLDSDMPEISQVVVEKDGSIVAAALAAPDPEPRAPSVHIQVPQGAAVGSAPDKVSNLDERPAPTLEGIIEGLASDGGETRGRRSRGRVVRVAPGGSVTELWRSSSEAPLALALDEDGQPVFGTGEPGRIYRVGAGGEVALLASLDEGQASRLVRIGDRLIVATSNPASAYRLEPGGSAGGEFVSRTFDAQADARWGTISWRGEGATAGVEVQVRSGNGAEPDASWSEWGAVISDPRGGRAGVPNGRFAQWRVRWSGASASARLSDMALSFVPTNRRPVLDGFRMDATASAVNGPLKLRWNVSDPDGDPVSVRVEFRAKDAVAWKTALRVDPAAADGDGGDGGDSWKEGKATWETAEVEEGAYELRAVASDQEGNPPGEGKEVVWEPSLAVTVDRSPPEIRAEADGSVDVEDSQTAVRRLEVLDQERVLFTLAPVDGVADSRREAFHLPSAAPGARKLRAFDAAGNSAVREIPSP